MEASRFRVLLGAWVVCFGILAGACGGSETPASSSGDGDGGSGGGSGQDVPPAGRCRTSKSADCVGTCVSPEDVVCYVPVQPSTTCVNDPDCGGMNRICTYLDGLCAGGPAFACAEGCTAATECPEGQACGPNHHCEKVKCNGSCDTDFVCSGEGHCVRVTCKADLDCAAGRCVLGLCHDDFGVCTE
jgi:hypothetical protein